MFSLRLSCVNGREVEFLELTTLIQLSSHIGGHTCPSAFLLSGLRANKITGGPAPFPLCFFFFLTKHCFLLIIVPPPQVPQWTGNSHLSVKVDDPQGRKLKQMLLKVPGLCKRPRRVREHSGSSSRLLEQLLWVCVGRILAWNRASVLPELPAVSLSAW